MGAEIAAPLTAALERINALIEHGPSRKKELALAARGVEAARQIRHDRAQQLVLASPPAGCANPREAQLADVLDGTLAHRARETLRLAASLKRHCNLQK